MTYKPEQYSISIRIEDHDGEKFYIGRVAELPDVMEVGETPDEARTLVIDTIATAMRVFAEQNRPFPAPTLFEETDFSGNITLKLPKTLHKNLSKQATADNVSLNTLLVSWLSQDWAERAKGRLA